MPDLWIKVRIKLRWLLAAVVATKEQSFREHIEASESKSPQRKAELHASGELQHEAHQGLKAVQTEIENDCE